MKLIIYGCGGHARSIADVALFNGYLSLEFVDNHAKVGEKIFNFDVCTLPIQANTDFILGFGDNAKRSAFFDQMDIQHLVSVIAKDAYIGVNSKINRGAYIAHAAYVGPNVIIGKNTIINTHSIVEHDSIIGDHSHISINATVAGRCAIGNRVMLGASATVIDGVKITDDVIIGAGAVVVKDISEPGTYVGTPARKIK